MRGLHEAAAGMRGWGAAGLVAAAVTVCGAAGPSAAGFAAELSPQGAESIPAYLKTWWTDQQRAEQAEVSERYQEALDAQTDSP